MKDRSSVQKSWHELGTISRQSTGYLIRDLLVRWNETTETITGPDGPQVQYAYDAHRIDLDLPAEVQQLVEVEPYLEGMKDTIIARAQALAGDEADVISTERADAIRDLTIGHTVDASMTLDAQIGAVRKQVAKISAALGIELDTDFEALQAAVEAAKGD